MRRRSNSGMAPPSCTRRRRCLIVVTASTLLSTLLGAVNVPYHAANAAAIAAVDTIPPVSSLSLSHDNISIEDGRRHHGRERQLHQQRQIGRHMRREGSKNICISYSANLSSGDPLYRGEFICRGDLRFGIDADNGYFMLGFVNWTNSTPSTSNENATVREGDEDVGDTMDLVDGREEEAEELDFVTPTLHAWRATPTALFTLFTPINQSFAYINLTEGGNLLGYDDEGIEVYDSNYDDINRLGSKRSNSYLTISDSCQNVTKISEEGEVCVRLTSPPRAGEPLGTDTWGIKVFLDAIVPVDLLIPPSMAPSTIAPSSTPPTTSLAPVSLEAQTSSLIPTTYSPSDISSFFATFEPVSSTSSTAAIIDTPTNAPSINYIVESETYESDSTTYIYGEVWIDSNRNGEIDGEEEDKKYFEVKLYTCADDEMKDHEEDTGEGNNDGNIAVARIRTDSEGYYFFAVITGRSYRVKFDINPYEYGFSSGVDTDADMLGWTECRSAKDGIIVWNAGLYSLNDTSYVANNLEAKASIGGHIYLDINENDNMEPGERTAAVGGYTVNNAFVAVSLKVCPSYEVIVTSKEQFPGIYSFDNLSEGSYQLRYELQALPPNSVPLYSFINNSEKNNSFVYETPCGKVSEGEDIDSGDIAVRSLEAISPYSAERPSDSDKEYAAPAGGARIAEQDTNSGDEKNALIPVFVGVVVILSLVTAAAFVVRHRNGTLSSISFLGRSRSTSEDVRSVRSFDREVRSLVSPSAQSIPIGSLIVETGTVKGGYDTESGVRQLGTTLNSSIDELPEEESVGFEVYDDEEDGEQGSLDYGPVISEIITKYSQKQGQNGEARAIDEGRESDGYGSGYNQVHTHSQYQDKSGVVTSPVRIHKHSPPRNSLRDIRDDHVVSEGKNENEAHMHYQSQDYHGPPHPGKYAASNTVVAPINGYSSISAGYEESQQQQPYQYDGISYVKQDDEKATSGSSRSADPPAASYRDIPTPHVGWNRDIQLVGDFHQYETQNQYVAGNNILAGSFTLTQDASNITVTDVDAHQMSNDKYIEYTPADSGNFAPAEQASTSRWSSFTSINSSIEVTGVSSSRSARSGSRRAQSNPRDGQSNATWRHKAIIPAHSTVEYNAYTDAYQSDTCLVQAEDNKSVLSLGSDQSSDPPGASYKNLDTFPSPEPPHKMMPPRKLSPNTSPNPRLVMSFHSPPPRSYPSPPPKGFPSPPVPPR